jgi:GH15 family glucan-1,4-alpha-glucosidase
MTNAPPERYCPIRDYGLIGDCKTAALVSRRGSIDWLCLPRFDSDAVFAAILDVDRGGSFAIHPTGDFDSTQRYVDDTNVLETQFTTSSGTLTLRDTFTVGHGKVRRGTLEPTHEILREIQCGDGEVEVSVTCDPRPDFGTLSPVARTRGQLGITWTARRLALALRSEVPLALESTVARGTYRLKAGERRFVSFAAVHGEPSIFLPLGDAAADRLEHSLAWWRDWAATITYEGPKPQTVRRSVLALKLLTYAPSGAVVAAPTTSLPETIGGVRNWDYRYCWLRDASWTLTAFLDLGLQVEGSAFLSWLLTSTQIARTRLNVLYDVFGRTRLVERELPHLEGYEGSRPVRIGNGAAGQFQLDIFGEVIECAYQFALRGGIIDRSEANLLESLGRAVCALWREPDEGIWEKRSGRFHHTYSKAMCWVALSRLVELADKGILAVPESFATERDAIHEAIESQAWNPTLNSYVDTFGGEGLDASLLLLGLRGYANPASSPRLQATFTAIRHALERDGLLYRYPPGDDGIPGGEAAFGICSFWVVEYLARAGDTEEALALFERLLNYASPLGLFAEEIDPSTGAALGNFPQAFTHVGLISAALALTEALGLSRDPSKTAASEKSVKM